MSWVRSRNRSLLVDADPFGSLLDYSQAEGFPATVTSASTTAEIRDLRVLFPASVVADCGAVLALSRPGWPVPPVPEVGDGLGDEVIKQVVEQGDDASAQPAGGGDPPTQRRNAWSEIAMEVRAAAGDGCRCLSVGWRHG